MNTDKILSPYRAPADFLAYVYDAVVLVWETRREDIISSKFDRKMLRSDCGIDVLMLDTLGEVQLRENDTWPTGEFLIFLRQGSGYKGLFKRLRDTFAHGHYESGKRNWIALRHRYKDRHGEAEMTRAFGNLRIDSLKKLVAFLDNAAPHAT